LPLDPTTEVMLMMRPARAFIIPRSTARQSRKTDLRSVSTTASHSASFMRSRRLSWVTPALFTRIETAPNSFSMAATSVSTPPESVTFSTAPRPEIPAVFSASPMPFAPASVVAVPTTVAPARPSASAIARPIPRDAPVTSATCPLRSMARRRAPTQWPA
jgi:hypothetical protein